MDMENEEYEKSDEVYSEVEEDEHDEMSVGTDSDATVDYQHMANEDVDAMSLGSPAKTGTEPDPATSAHGAATCGESKTAAGKRGRRKALSQAPTVPKKRTTRNKRPSRFDSFV